MAKEDVLDAHLSNQDWWSLAEKYPLQAIESPLYALLTLEDPLKWLRLEEGNAAAWIYEETARWQGDSLLLRYYAVDCAEHVIPLWEDLYKDDLLPRQLMTKIRACLATFYQDPWWNRGPQWQELSSYTWERIIRGLDPPEYVRNAMKALHGAALFSETTDHLWAARNVTRWAGWAATRTTMRVGDGGLPSEKVWQWRRLVEYAQGKVVP